MNLKYADLRKINLEVGGTKSLRNKRHSKKCSVLLVENELQFCHDDIFSDNFFILLTLRLEPYDLALRVRRATSCSVSSIQLHMRRLILGVVFNIWRVFYWRFSAAVLTEL